MANEFRIKKGLIVNETDLYVSGSKTGIGTNTPSVVLEVADVSPQIQFTDTVNASAYSRILATDAGGLIIDADKGNAGTSSYISLRVDDTERVKIDSSGNVGIGETTPASLLHLSGSSNNAIITLENNGNGNISGMDFVRERSTGPGVNGGSLFLESNTSGTQSFLYLQAQTASADAGITSALTAGNGVRLILKGGQGIFSVETGASETFKVDNGDVTLTGDLTVGGKVTAQEFHTEFVSASIIYQSGSTKFGDTNDDVHSFSGSIGLSNTPSDSIIASFDHTGFGSRQVGLPGRFMVGPLNNGYPQIGYNFTTSGGSYTKIANDEAWRITFGASNRMDFSFAATGTGTFSWNDYLSILQTGEVGIGTTSPHHKLHVAGNIAASRNASTTALNGQFLVYWDSNNPTDRYLYGMDLGYNGTYRTRIKAPSSYDIALSTAPDTSMGSQSDYTDHLVVKGSTGNVGIGTTSPTASLHVAGPGYFEGGTISFNDTVNNAGIVIDEGYYIYTRDGNNLRQLIGKVSDVIYIGQAGTSLVDEIRLLPGIDGPVTFYSGSSEYARFDAGRLGIGTALPTYTLDVAGNASIDYSLLGRGFRAADRGELHLNSTGTNDVSEIFLGYGDGFTEANIRWAISDRGTTTGKLEFYRGPALGGFSSVMTLDGLNKRLGIGTSNPTVPLQVAGTISGSSDLSIDGNSVFDGTVGYNTFNSGFGGNGWRIDSNANAEFQNLTVRGTFSVYELLAQQVRATNGSLLVATSGKVDDISGTTLFFDTGSSYGHGFSTNDILLAQRLDPEGTQLKRSFIQVTGTSNTGSLTYSLLGSSTPPEVGFEYVRIGNTTDPDRQGHIYLTADDNFAPYIGVRDGVNAYTDFTSGTGSVEKVRVGRLDGVTSANFGSLSGYGLWASGSVYLEGGINATSGKIADLNITSTKIYTGAGNFNNADTGFYVDNSSNFSLGSKFSWNGSALTIDGNITATAGNIGGFTISSDALSGTNFYLSGSATGNEFFISSSNFNVKANGDVTGSNSLFVDGVFQGVSKADAFAYKNITIDTGNVSSYIKTYVSGGNTYNVLDLTQDSAGTKDVGTFVYIQAALSNPITHIVPPLNDQDYTSQIIIEAGNGTIGFEVDILNSPSTALDSLQTLSDGSTFVDGDFEIAPSSQSDKDFIQIPPSGYYMNALERIVFIKSGANWKIQSSTRFLNINILNDLVVDSGTLAVTGSANKVSVNGILAVNSDDLYVDSGTGYAGFGTTNPWTELEVVGSDPVLTVRDSSTSIATGKAYLRLAESGAGNTQDRFVQIALSGSASGTNLTFDLDGNEKMRINESGNVGIGTTSPDEKLNVLVGAGGANGTVGIKVGGLNNYDSLELGIEGNYAGMIRSYGNDIKYYAGHWRTIGNTASENHSHYWYTSKASSSDWSSAKMTLNHDGNLGIGTTSPDDKLHVQGNVFLTDGSPEITLETTSATHYNWQIAAQENVDAALEFSVGSQDADASNDTFSPLMVIKNTGNVGIGDTSPSNTLVLKRSSSGQGEFGLRYEYTDTDGPTNTSAAVLVGAYGIKFKNYNSSRDFIFETGNVGIGTTNPAKLLHVEGNGVVHGNLQISGSKAHIHFNRPNGSNVGAIGWDDTDNVFYVAGHPDYGSTAGNIVRVYGFGSDVRLGDSTNGDVLTVDATNGNVGIGTTTPTSGKLQVEGNIFANGGDITGSNFRVGEYIHHAGDANTYIRFQPDDISLIAAGNNLFRVDNTAPLREIVVNEAGAATNFRIESDTVTDAFFVTASNGYVGIGTTSPEQTLDVDGTVRVQSTGAATLILDGDTNNSGDTGNTDSIIDMRHDAGTYGMRLSARNFSGKSAFRIQENRNGSYSERFYIDEDGDVGIGTITPSSKLDVNGDIIGDSFSSDGLTKLYAWRIDNSSSSSYSTKIASIAGGQSARIKIELTGQAGYSANSDYGSKVVILGQFNNDDNFDGHYYLVGNEAAVSAVKVVQTGTNTAEIWIDRGQFAEYAVEAVACDATITPFDTDGTPSSPETLSAYLHIHNEVKINDALGVNVAPSATAGRIDASNDVVAFSTSDKRLKENITKLGNPLDKISKINGVEFDWKPLTEEERKTIHGFEGHDVGVIAQEIEEVLPEVVTERDNGYKAVKYEKIVPLLIEGIKELKQENDTLKKELNEIKKILKI